MVAVVELESNDIKDGQPIAKEFGCDVAGYNPELHWRDFPPETKSFAIIVKDPDAPRGTFYHWFVCNIPKGVSSVARDSVPSGAIEARNDSGRKEYCAPCPPSGTHRYYYTVYSLDSEKLYCGSREELLHEIERHKLAEATIMGTFKRK